MSINHDEPADDGEHKQGMFTALAAKIRRPFGGVAMAAAMRERSRGRLAEKAADLKEEKHLLMMQELQGKLQEHDGTPSGAAFATLNALEGNYPGSVKSALEIDPDRQDSRRVFLARLTTDPAKAGEGLNRRTLLNAKPFVLPGYNGSSASEVDVAVHPDGHATLRFTRPREQDGPQFSANFVIDPTRKTHEGEAASQLFGQITTSVGFKDILPPDSLSE